VLDLGKLWQNFFRIAAICGRFFGILGGFAGYERMCYP
jgi:hypothetical protein